EDAIETMRTEDLRALGQSLGHNVALLHNAAPRPHAAGITPTPDWHAQSVERLASRLRASKTAGNVSADLLDAIGTRCTALLRQDFGDITPGLVHWDLH